MTKIKIKTSGMHCTSCEMLLQDALSEIEGVKGAKADHKNGLVQVELDETKVNVDQIKRMIRKEGYDPQ